ISILLDNKLFCQLCHVLVNEEKKYYITAHIKTIKHQNKTNSNLTYPKQTFFNEKDNSFTEIITEAFLSANIPLHKLRHPAIKTLFNKLNQPILKETTCRRATDRLFLRLKLDIRKILENKLFFLIIDESQYIDKKYLNLQIRILSEPEKNYLVYCKVILHISGDCVKNIVLQVIEDHVLCISHMALFIFDAASYMVNAEKELKILNPNLFYITCFVHMIHNCALKIKKVFKEVDFLISSLKCAVVKSNE
ncbi:hypothetical protein CDIK_4263, partial [Cucumispora dikerogammari]